MINGGKTKTILQKSKTVMKIPLLQKPKKKNVERMTNLCKSGSKVTNETLYTVRAAMET